MSANPKVLFADDDNDTLELLGLCASRSGVDYCLAHTGQEVNECLRSNDFDVLCLDVRLPDVYGTTLAAAVRERDASLPMIFFTGYTGREVRKVAEECDVTMVIKPEAPERLMRVIHELARMRRPRYEGKERRYLGVNTTLHRRRRWDRPLLQAAAVTSNTVRP